MYRNAFAVGRRPEQLPDRHGQDAGFGQVVLDLMPVQGLVALHREQVEVHGFLLGGHGRVIANLAPMTLTSRALGSFAMTSVRILDAGDVRDALDMASCIDACERAFAPYSAGDAELPGVIHLDVPESGGEIHVKAGHLHGEPFYAVKVASGFARAERARPSMAWWRCSTHATARRRRCCWTVGTSPICARALPAASPRDIWRPSASSGSR